METGSYVYVLPPFYSYYPPCLLFSNYPLVCLYSGRLVDGAGTKLAKDEVLQMIRHGAEKIFASKDATITDDDIDRILEDGMVIV